MCSLGFSYALKVDLLFELNTALRSKSIFEFLYRRAFNLNQIITSVYFSSDTQNFDSNRWKPTTISIIFKVLLEKPKNRIISKSSTLETQNSINSDTAF